MLDHSLARARAWLKAALACKSLSFARFETALQLARALHVRRVVPRANRTSIGVAMVPLLATMLDQGLALLEAVCFAGWHSPPLCVESWL